MVEKEMEKEDGMEMEDEEGGKDWEAECAAQDLLRAEKVKKDPELLAKALKLLGEQKATITSLEQLKAVASKKMLAKKEPKVEDESES